MFGQELACQEVDNMNHNNDKSLDFYVSYDSFFLTSQLYDVLFDIENIYNVIYASMAHTDMRSIDFNSKMRIKSINTGESITLQLIEGVNTVIQSGSPVIQVSAAVGVFGIVSKIIISASKGVAEIRKLWHEGTKVKYEKEAAREKFLKEKEAKEKEKLIIVPDEAKRIASDSASHLINLLEYSPNIDLVKVNGAIIINKKDTNNQRR